MWADRGLLVLGPFIVEVDESHLSAWEYGDDSATAPEER